MAANREEKQLEMATEVMLQRINEMKLSLNSLMWKLDNDHQNITFPDFLDAFSVISGQVSQALQFFLNLKLFKDLYLLKFETIQCCDYTYVSDEHVDETAAIGQGTHVEGPYRPSTFAQPRS